MAAEFVPGITLARRYYTEVVRPLLDRHAPGLDHAAGLLGWGSDVLGYDSPRSTDHNWGPRCQVFLGPADAWRAAEILAMLDASLPADFAGWPTRFPDVTVAPPAPRHWVEVAELGGWLTRCPGFDPRAGVSLLDWLATPAQVLAELTGGAVFHDGLAAEAAGLDAARRALAWYPDDVWRYVLACQWTRISQEEAFPGRCAETGDQLGSAVVAARLARDIMRLALLLHRRYPPYSKWLGAAFAKLPGIGPLRDSLARALAATAWPDRERHLSAAYQAIAALHNSLGLTEPLDLATRPFHDRPYSIIDGGRFAAPLLASIGDTAIAGLPMAGAIDQFVDSTDAVAQPGLRRAAIAALLG